MIAKQVLPLIAAAMMACMAIAARAEWPQPLREAQAKCQRQLAAAGDVTIVQTMTMHTPEGEFASEQIVYYKGEKTRVEMTLHMPAGGLRDGMQTVMIDDGAESWVINSLSGKTKDTEGGGAHAATTQRCWNFTPENSQITGEGTAQGRACYLVELTHEKATHTLWLDQETLRVLQGETRDTEAAVRWVLTDFRAADGYEHPYKVELYDGDALLAEMRVQSVQTQADLPDELFDPDKVELKPLDMEDLMRRMLQGQEGK